MSQINAWWSSAVREGGVSREGGGERGEGRREREGGTKSGVKKKAWSNDGEKGEGIDL